MPLNGPVTLFVNTKPMIICCVFCITCSSDKCSHKLVHFDIAGGWWRSAASKRVQGV